MTQSLSRRAAVAVALTLACAASLHAQVPVSTQPAAQAGARPVFVNGMAQVVPAFADSSQWIRQELWVETDFDSDHDGKQGSHARRRHAAAADRDRGTEGAGAVRVEPVLRRHRARPGELERAAGARRTPPSRAAPCSIRRIDSTRTRISTSLVNKWVPRGFAVVHSEAPGTGRSQGCPTVGDNPERTAMKFVIDWLNGRAKGYATETGTEQVSATSWSTGKVGMIGTSYEGTLPLAAATTGVAGLDVVVPVSPNTSYYHYYRANGLVRSPGGYLGEDVDVLYDFIASGDPATRAVCDRIWKNGVFAAGQDRATGDYNDFWAARDLLPHVKNIQAAVLLAHGLNDYNVVPEHSVRIYDEMKARGLPVSMYLHQGGHGGNPPAEMVNRWFSHYLYGVDNGVGSDPAVWIVSSTAADSAAARARASGQRGVMPAPVPFASFPVPGSAPVRLHPTAGGNGIARLALAPLARDWLHRRRRRHQRQRERRRAHVVRTACSSRRRRSPTRCTSPARRASRCAWRRPARGEPQRLARDAALRLGAARLREPRRRGHARVGRHPEPRVARARR